MATLRDIKRRIKAVKNTRQITRAMKMVAASKLRKSQSRMLELRPYADKMRSVILSLGEAGSAEAHPLFAQRGRKTIGVLVIASDRGLCGAFNSNILRAANAFIAEKKDTGLAVSVNAVGKKTVDFFTRRGVELDKRWMGLSGRVTFTRAQEIAESQTESFLALETDETYLVYNQFKSVMAQEITVVRLLPLSPIVAEEGPENAAAAARAAGQGKDFIYEPTEKEIYDSLLPKNVEIQVFRALLESQASEEAARMTAMENASQNADEMIDKLSLVANKVRQAAITNELLDIVGGVEALK